VATFVVSVVFILSTQLYARHLAQPLQEQEQEQDHPEHDLDEEQTEDAPPSTSAIAKQAFIGHFVEDYDGESAEEVAANYAKDLMDDETGNLQDGIMEDTQGGNDDALGDSRLSCLGALRDAVKDKIKIAVSYFQVVTSFQVNLSIPWPDALKDWLSLFGIVNIDFVGMAALECISPNSSYYSKFCLVMASPIIISALCMLSYIMGRTFISASDPGWAHWKAKIIFIWSIFLFLAYPTVSSSAVRMWNCKDIDGTSWLVADMSIMCAGDT
jgi:hypothetical protein